MTTVFVGGVPGAVARLTEEFPDVTVIDLRGYEGEIPSDAVLFASHLSAEGLAAAESGVFWNALPYTGIDSAHPAHLSATIVTCARGALAEPIAEYVFTTILAKNRNFPEFWIKEPPAGKWAWNIQERELSDGRSIQPLSLSGQRLGIFGFGGIGQQIARLGLAFGMDVVACRRSDTPSEIEGVRLVTSIEALIEDTDHLVLCAPHTKSTEGIVNAMLLGRAKPGLHLINVARGTLINDEALRTWLDGDGAARASLDVCEPEPLLDPESWLYHHDLVFLTPHSSWMGQPYMASALDQFCANLKRFLSGQPLEGVIDLTLGY